MSDTPTPPPPADNGDKPKRTRNPINQEFLDEIKNARAIAKAATSADYAPRLAEVELDPAHAAAIPDIADEVEADIGTLLGSRAAKKSKTGEHDADREAILAAMAPIQTAAKRKYKDESEAMRSAYGIGDNFSTQSTDDLATFATAVLRRLDLGEGGMDTADTLPGIKLGPGGAIEALRKALAKRAATAAARSEHQAKSTATLEDITTKIATLAAHRKNIQLAADQAWPWRTPGVESTRKAFQLPTDRPLTD